MRYVGQPMSAWGLGRVKTHAPAGSVEYFVDAVLENYIFRISPKHEFSLHSQGQKEPSGGPDNLPDSGHWPHRPSEIERFWHDLPNIALIYGVHQWTEAVFGFGARSIAILQVPAHAGIDASHVTRHDVLRRGLSARGMLQSYH